MYRTNNEIIDEKIAFLQRAYVAALQVESCRQHIQRLKDKQTEAVNIVASGGGRRWRARKLEDISALLMDRIDEYARLMTRLLVVENEVQSSINGLNNAFYQYILTERYINNKSCGEIADAIHYSRSSVLRFHRLALNGLNIKKPEA